MNNDLISRAALSEELSALEMTITGLRAGKGILREYMTEYRKSVLRIVDEAPAVDADPAQHGHWIEDHMDWKCSCCNTVFHDDLEWILAYDGQAMPKYCPECGARMDEEAKRCSST